jgi:hypothetical protein
MGRRSSVADAQRVELWRRYRGWENGSWGRRRVWSAIDRQRISCPGSHRRDHSSSPASCAEGAELRAPSVLGIQRFVSGTMAVPGTAGFPSITAKTPPLNLSCDSFGLTICQFFLTSELACTYLARVGNKPLD